MELADRGLSKAQIARILHRNPKTIIDNLTAKNFLALADALGVAPHDLI